MVGVFTLSFLLVQTTVYAQDDSLLTSLVQKFYNVVLPLAVIMGFLLILKAGYALMTSQGDPSKVSEGKEDLTSAIMGLLFVFLSIGILRVIIKGIIDTAGF